MPHNFPRKIGIRSGCAGRDARESRNQPIALYAADLWKARLNFAQAAMQHLTHNTGIRGQLFIEHDIDGRKCSRATNRVAGVSGRHGSNGLRIHDLRGSGDGRERKRTRNALAEKGKVRHNSVMLETPHCTRSPETGLNFV